MKTKTITQISISILLCMNMISCKQEKKIDLQQSVIIKGSESERSLTETFAAEFMKDNKNVSITVEGGGSEIGILELKNGNCNIANSSRVFSDDDYYQCKSKNVKQAIVAVDAIAIVTNPATGMRPLSIKQLSDIYSGTIKNWKEIGGPDAAIIPVGRKEGSGTRQYMQSRLVVNRFAEGIQELSNYEGIINFVRTNKNAIGYVSLKYAMRSKGKSVDNIQIVPMYIDDMLPSLPFNEEVISNGDYPLIRPLFQYYNAKQNPSIEKLIEFELSPEGQELAKATGYYPINDFHKQINRTKM